MDSDLSRPPATLSRPGEGLGERSKVLIIGAKGMLGQELIRAFSNQEVLAWDKDEIDITDAIKSKIQITNFKPDLIINSAAYNDVDGAETNADVANAVNGHAVGELAKVCKELNISLVHFSTEYVFDGVKQEGYKEDDVPNPISVYGKSKYLGEQELAKNTDKFYLIRLSRLFGRRNPLPQSLPPGEGKEKREYSSPLSGGGKVGGKRSFVDLMLELARTKDTIEVVDEELSSPTYAPDLAQATREIVEKKLPFGIYHRTNSGACTWYEFAAEIFKISGKSVKLNPVASSQFPRPAKRPSYGVLLNTKLPPMRDWREALKDFLDLSPTLSPSPGEMGG